MKTKPTHFRRVGRKKSSIAPYPHLDENMQQQAARALEDQNTKLE